MSVNGNRDASILGREPRVDLLPPEVHAQAKNAGVRRLLIYILIGVIVLVIAGTAAATLGALSAQRGLASEQARTQDLLAQQGGYVKVRGVQADVSAAEAAQRVGASSEIDWQNYIDRVQASLPHSVVLVTVDTDSISPMAVYAQATTPLQGPRVATLSFTASSPTLPDVAAWLDALGTLPGFADATPGSVVGGPGGYTVSIVMHINKEAYSNRFVQSAGTGIRK